MPTYRCPICQTRLEYAGRLPSLYPFCSEHCRLVDLGLWFREAYTLDHEPTFAENTPDDGPSTAPPDAPPNA